MSTRFDVVIIGGGPAGLSAALILGRARASVLVIDGARPRNAATLRAHGFLTRDGVSPLELRKLAQAELAAYPGVRLRERETVTSVRRADPGAEGFSVSSRRGTAPHRTATSPVVLLATGLRETLPDIPGMTDVYGMSLFSCAVCDGWELRDRPLALIGEHPDLAERAVVLARWTDRLTVFTRGADVVTVAEEARLRERGIRVERRQISRLESEHGSLRAVRLADGDVVGVDGGLVRPRWHAPMDFLDDLHPHRDEEGLVHADDEGQTSVPGLYAAGDGVSPGVPQLIVAAGQGARVASAIMQRLPPPHSGA